MIKTTPTSGLRPLSRRRRQSKGLIADNNRQVPSSPSRPENVPPSPSRGTTEGDGIPNACYSARLAAACIENCLEMGVITKFALTPQGRARKTLLLRSKARRGGAHGRRQDEFLSNPPDCGPDLDEYSSGDDDDFDDASGSGARSKEPLWIPTGTDAASSGLQAGQTKNLPFNYRKLPYFDAVTAQDRAVARGFLRKEMADAKKMRGRALADHLRNVQRRERERIERGMQGEDDVGDVSIDLEGEEEALRTAVRRFPGEMTQVKAAALLIESLAMNHNESVEGMARCYDGIVSAGTVLLDSMNERDAKKLTTQEIVAALEPLLVTTLEQASGEVILGLARLKSYCGTKRYQRRFVQRIAPFLVRPADAAVWCLRHQNDIEPIIAAVEMILDNAAEVFSPGWYERGRNLLKDKKRAEKLRLAAVQLRRLNSPSPTEGLLSGLSSSSVHRRGSLLGAGGRRDTAIGNEPLAEWEIVAIDKHIRQSVLDIFSRDWSRISALNLSPKESDTMPYGSRRRSGISAAKSKEWQEAAAASTASTLSKSPRSKIPLSPRGPPVGVAQMPSADALESTFGPSFSSQNIDDENITDRPQSPPNYTNATPLSPTRDMTTKLGTPQTPPHQHEVRNESYMAEHPSSPGTASRMGLAPLSPQSSVGNASTSSAGAMSLRSVTGGPGGNRDQYRTLTSTAAERKRTVAACRALRAQITKFEESFIQMHGRAPKGAAERAPLASTYMQYREWKRAIRADAACRIQALCRGAYVRSMMLRSKDPRVARLVSLRRARPRKGDHRTSDHLSHLSIPLDIGGSDQIQSSIVEQVSNRVNESKSRLEARASPRSDDGVEVVMRPNATNAAASPNWKMRQPAINQPGSSPGSHSQRQTPGKSRNSLPDVTVMSLPELQQRKRELKQQLKMYDLNFHAQHGRMPEKREKEPIRHLYESYNAYKNQISVIEKGEAQPGPGTAAFRGRDDSITASSATESLPDRSSPSAQVQLVKSPSNDNSNSPGNTPEFADESPESMNNSDDIVVLSQDLAALKAEKATLHQMLRTYEKDFLKQHKRQVSSFGDIRPVAGQYRRYKEIKKAIASLQDK